MGEVNRLEELLQAGPRGLLDLLRDERDRASIVAQLWEAAQTRAAGKAQQKAAKKALYTLRSSGVDVDRYRPERRPGADESGVRLEVTDALLSVPDGLGNSQLVIALTDQAGSSLTLYRFVINSLRGVQHYSRTGGSRRALHRAREEGLFFPVSAAYAQFRLGKALEKTDRNRISGLGTLPPQVEGTGEPVIHPAREIADALLSRIITPEEEKRIFSVAEIGSMMLPEEDVAETRRQIAEARASRLVLANRTPEERMQAILLRFYRTYFTRERLEDLSTRLLDVAASLHHRGIRGLPRMLVHYADSLRSPGLVPEKHPLLNFLAYRAFMQPPEQANR